MRQLITSIAIAISMASYCVAAPKFGPWTSPVNLGCASGTPAGINSTFNDEGPAVSKNGLTLYFGSNRPTAPDDTILDLNLWVSEWDFENQRWGTPTFLGSTINSAGTDNIPMLSRDGHWLFFNSDRPGGQGLVDIWASWRQHVHDDFAWSEPVNLGPIINSSGFDGGASYVENDDGGNPQLFFGRGPVNVLADIYMSEFNNGSWSTPARIDELSTSDFFEGRPAVRFDGLEVFLFSNRTVYGAVDLWTSTRESADGSWEPLTNLGGVVNSAFVDQQPHITADRGSLYFVSNRPGGCGGGDIYVTTRTQEQ